MKSLGLYLLQMIVASGILYGYYHLFLRNKKFHQYNRYYLLSATVIAILIPFLKIPFYFTENEEATSSILKTLKTVYYSSGEEVIVTASANRFNWNIIPMIAYSIIATVLLARILISVFKIKQIIRTNKAEELDGIYFINTTEPGTPFSFFRWLFWNKNIELQSEKGQQIFRHEVFHIQQKHSWDVFFIEVINMLFWVNPFFHIIKKEIRAIHEFLADEFATKEKDKWEYAELLLMQVLHTNQKLVTPFFHTQIKRRIAMITNSQKPSHRYLRKLLVLPLTVIITLLFAFTYKNKNAEANSLPPDPVSNDIVLTTDTVPQNKKVKPEIELLAKTSEAANNLTEITVDGKKIVAQNVTVEGVKSPETKITSIRINGEKAMGTPLILVDGVKQDKDKSLNQIQADAIKSISVLKGTTGVGLYGSEAEDGVILIETKKKNPEEIIVEGYPMQKVAMDSAIKLKLSEVTVNGYPKPVAGKNAEVNLDLSEVVVTGFGTVKKQATEKEPSVSSIKKETGIVFEKAETPATFRGGDAAWRKFLERNLNSAVPVDNNAPNGSYTVVVQFLVKKDGYISDIKALTNQGYGMEEEAMKVIKAGPTWVPAKQNGQEVNSYKIQPITFTVIRNDEDPIIPGSTLNEVVIIGYGKTSPKKAEDKAATFEQMKPIYPNPANDKINFQYNSKVTGKGEIRIIDMNGNLKKTEPMAFFKGNNAVSINVVGLAKGMYMISVKGPGTDEIRAYKMVKE